MKTISTIILSMIMMACGGNVANENERFVDQGIQSNDSEEANPLDTNILGTPLEDATTGLEDITGETVDSTGVLPPANDTIIDPTINDTSITDVTNITLNPTTDSTTSNTTGTIADLISGATGGTNNISTPLLDLIGLGQPGSVPNINNLIGNVLNGGNGIFPGTTTQNNLFCSALCPFNTGASSGRPLLDIVTRIKQPICGC